MPRNMLLRLWDSGTACVAVAAFIFSILSVLVKIGSSTIPVLQLVCVPSFLSAVVLGARLCLASDRAPPAPKSTTPTSSGRLPTPFLLFVRGLLGAVVVSGCFGAIELLPLEDAITLFFCNPVFVVIIEAAMNRASAGLNGLMGCLLTMAGVVLISQPPLLFSAGPAGPQAARQKLGVFLGLAAAGANAVSFIVVRALSDVATTTEVTFWYHVVVCLVTAAPLSLGWPRPPVLHPTVPQLALIAGVFSSTFTGQLLLNRGLQLESATRGSAINVMQVLYSYLWNLVIFKEPFSLTGLLGSMSIVMGVVSVGGQDCWLGERRWPADVAKGQEAGRKRVVAAGDGKRATEDEEQQQPLLVGQRASSDDEIAGSGGLGLGSRRGRTASAGELADATVGGTALVGVEELA